jgi:hypothetical protein
MAPLEMNEGTTTVLGVGHNKLTNSCSAEDPAKRPLTFLTFTTCEVLLPVHQSKSFPIPEHHYLDTRHPITSVS